MSSQFKKLNVALTLVTVVTSLSFIPNSKRSDNDPKVVGCLKERNVPYATSSSPNWVNLTTPYNLRLPYTPAVVTLPKISKHVGDSVTCAAAAKLKVQPKGGGHSYASYSSGGQNGSLIIDMESFNSVKVNQTTWVAKVGSGVRLGNMALAIYAQGKRALPHGTCPGVGIGGHATHGGYGYASRKWGLTLDTIVALDVVLANGTEVHATETHFSVIFYAMRGAGDSFGVVTYFYLQTFPAPKWILNFSANLRAALRDINIITAGFQNLQNFALTSQYLTPNITFGMYTDSGGSLSISGWCMECDPTDFNTSVFPAMLTGFPATGLSVQTLGWIDALKAVANGDTLAQPLQNYNEHSTFYAKSVVSHNAQPLTAATINSFWSYMIKNQGQGPFYSIINLYGGPGSQINAPSPDSSAYSDRDALWIWQNQGYTASGLPPYNPADTALIDGLNNATTALQSDGRFTAYSNYVDPDLSAQQAAELYYGPKTYDKLLKIKAEVDPDFVFWNPQAVGNAPVLPPN